MSPENLCTAHPCSAAISSPCDCRHSRPGHGQALRVKITLPRSIATLLLVGLASAMLFHWGDISEAAENDCAAAKASYEMNKRRVGEYLVALERAESRGEANLVEVLKRKIDQLLEQIVDAENPGQCERKTNVKMPSGISPAKSD